MKLYIVTETSREENLILRTWVCFTKEQAADCLKKQYEVACVFNKIAGVSNPSNYLEKGFFFWTLTNGLKLQYRIREAETFAE